MDTQDAIASLTAMLSTLQSQITGYKGQADALTVALGILNATLTTQLAALDAANATLAAIDPTVVATAQASLQPQNSQAASLQ